MKEEKIDPNDPSQTSRDYDEMLPKWEKIEAVLGGTDAMRAAGETYLPQHAEEEPNRYNERLNTATLYNVTEQTLNTWVGKPFSDPIQYSEDMPQEVMDLLEDVDLMGNNLNVFARNWFRDGLAKAYSYALIEYPRRNDETDDGKPVKRTLQNDRTERLRPYWVHIKPENVICAHTEIRNGKQFYVHVRIKEEVQEMEGFAEVFKQQIRVITPGLQEVYREEKQSNGKIEWVRKETFKYDLDFIPLVRYKVEDKPPLIDLVDLNIAHWQSTSDQRCILTVARFPILASSGGSAETTKLVVGPFTLLASSDPQSKFYYVEHTGNAIESGRKDLIDLEQQMMDYGSEFMKKKPSGETATARAMDGAEATSPLQDMTVRFIDALNLALLYTAKWMKIENPGTVVISTDFGPDEINSDDLTTLRESRKNRDISRRAYLTELMRRGVLSDDFDMEADAELIEEELSKLAELVIDEEANPTLTKEEEDENENEE